MNGSQLYCILLDVLLPAGQEDDLQVRESLVIQEPFPRIYKQFEGKYCRHCWEVDESDSERFGEWNANSQQSEVCGRKVCFVCFSPNGQVKLKHL